MAAKGTPTHRLSDPETWLDQYGDYMYRYAMARVQNPSVAEDLVQETFAQALRARERFEGRASEKTWLTSILRHKTIDHFRKRGRERPADNWESPEDWTDQFFKEDGHLRIGLSSWGEDPHALFEQSEFWKVFYRCVSELSDRLATAFLLREIDGLSTEEICKVLNITATNCWVMLHRARMGTRRCLEINWFETEKAEKDGS
jgi:RNA polymerase sigma-70 factor (ECF subfamily)